MEIIFANGVFLCRCTYDERTLPYQAGFRWDNELKKWYTLSYGVAARLNSYFSESAAREANRLHIQIKNWTHGLVVPEEEKLLPFQQNAAKWALDRNRSYLALDPGLGKTPISAVITATLNKQNPVACVYICPPFLTRNTEVEFLKWAPHISTRRFKPGTGLETQMLIVPDSILTRTDTLKEIKKFANYARGYNFTTLLFVDEAHRFKNDKAARTQALFGKFNQPDLTHHFDRVVYLSGTPMPNRPIELFPVLSNSAPETIDNMSKFEYAKKYCAAYRDHFGWNFSGSSNLEELALKVKNSFMLRYRKMDVLKQLPPKLEEMVVLSDNLPPKLKALTHEILKTLPEADIMSGRISAKLQTGENLHLATYRKELGILKIKQAVEWLKYQLEESAEESFLVFAIHKDVVKGLTADLQEFDPLVITGDTRMELRHAMVNEFQTNSKRRLFIGNIQAAGTGFTLTKATRVVFVEFSWTPSDNDQAADRCHRIGQDSNVLVQYLVHQESVDKTVIETVLRKKKVTGQV